jgi:sec-independent protein translocase protein TatA
MSLDVLALSMPGGGQLLVIAFIGLLLFGKRLPEVGRSLGQSIIQFKKGLKEAESEIMQVDEPKALPRQEAPAQQQAAPTFKFDPYTGKPLQADTTQQHESR